MTRALFVVLDGPDGCGKSTQAAALVERLRTAGRDAVHLRDPGGTRAGEKIRGVLLDPAEKLGTAAEVFLFMASRAQLVEQVLAPAIREKKTVVCERWLSSTIAYQGVAGGFGAGHVAAIGRHSTGGFVPDLLAILDVPPEVGLGRVKRGLDRMEAKGAEYHQRVREGFLALKKEFPRSAVVDATRPVAEVGESIWKLVEPLL